MKCGPTHLVSRVTSPCGDGYRVAWRINPHMQPGATRIDIARAQHRALRAALWQAGAQVLELPFVPGCYDCVFVKDAAVLARREGKLRALLARPRHPERCAEIASRRRALEQHGFAITAARHRLEGGDVVLAGETLLLGYGFRTDANAVDDLAHFAGRPVLPLRLVDPHFYHLDTAVAWLDSGVLLVAERALPPDDERKLGDVPGVAQVIRVPREEALELGLNVVQIGRQVVIARGAARAAARLQALGYEPVRVPLDQYRLAGGGAACLTASVHDLEPEAASQGGRSAPPMAP